MNIQKSALESDCFDAFGYDDFDPERIRIQRNWSLCPVRGCDEKLGQIEIGVKRISKIPVCIKHGLRLHSGTFVYWNGVSNETRARLRNIQFQPEWAVPFLEGRTTKVESARLGYEMSEDALSWNVFVGLLSQQRLADAARYLCGIALTQEPELYLWGIRVAGQAGGELYEPLKRVRNTLERGIKNYVTEPDIMLVIPGEILVCIEAKFGSGNPLARHSRYQSTEKPTDKGGLVERYLQPAATAARSAINVSAVDEPLHSQLFRNVVFAAEMAKAASIPDWRVVNLVGARQWDQARANRVPTGYSFDDPTKNVCGYLAEEYKQRFSFRTWEGLHNSVISSRPELAQVALYMKEKSAHFASAFDLV